jgi:type II restriction enzyme
MENIVGEFVRDICERHGYAYLSEANAEKIFHTFGVRVPVDKSSRRYDFVSKNGKDILLLETNFYGGGGSKLKSTAGEYRNLFDVLEGNFKFIWITDGFGWKRAQRPLRETYDHNDYLLSLKLVEDGLLEEIVG